ncbi:helix-turn-helix domain-containing protein, partial [Bartonella tribocorum]
MSRCACTLKAKKLTELSVFDSRNTYARALALGGGLSVQTKNPHSNDILIGKRIRLRREMLKMSQKQLGHRLGITFQQVQKYEKGLNRVGAGRLQEIADILDISIFFFYADISTKEHI